MRIQPATGRHTSERTDSTPHDLGQVSVWPFNISQVCLYNIKRGMERLKCESNSSKDSICGFQSTYVSYMLVHLQNNLQNDQIYMHLKTSDFLFQENESMTHLALSCMSNKILQNENLPHEIPLISNSMQQIRTHLQKLVVYVALALHLELHGCALPKSFNLLALNRLKCSNITSKMNTNMPVCVFVCTPKDVHVSIPISGVKDTKRGKGNTVLTLTKLLLM